MEKRQTKLKPGDPSNLRDLTNLHLCFVKCPVPGSYFNTGTNLITSIQ